MLAGSELFMQECLRHNLVLAGSAGPRPGAEEGGGGSGGGGSSSGGRQRLRRRAGQGGEDRGEDCQDCSGSALPAIEASAARQCAVCMRVMH